MDRELNSQHENNSPKDGESNSKYENNWPKPQGFDSTKITRQRDGWVESSMVSTKITRQRMENGIVSTKLTRPRAVQYKNNSPKGWMGGE